MRKYCKQQGGLDYFICSIFTFYRTELRKCNVSICSTLRRRGDGHRGGRNGGDAYDSKVSLDAITVLVEVVREDVRGQGVRVTVIYVIRFYSGGCTARASAPGLLSPMVSFLERIK